MTILLISYESSLHHIHRVYAPPIYDKHPDHGISICGLLVQITPGYASDPN